MTPRRPGGPGAADVQVAGAALQALCATPGETRRIGLSDGAI